MTEITAEEWTVEDFISMLKTLGEPPLRIVFDVDCTLVGAEIDGTWNVRPGAIEVLRGLHTHGHELHLWSAGSATHCEEVSDLLGIGSIITGFHSKPDHYPMTREGAQSALGWIPDVVIDDDPGESVPGSTFIRVSQFWGPLG